MSVLVYDEIDATEPNLLIPGKKPVGPVVLAGSLAPDWYSLIRDLSVREGRSNTLATKSAGTNAMLEQAGGIAGSDQSSYNHDQFYWNNLPTTIGTGSFAVFFVGTLFTSASFFGAVLSNSGGTAQWRLQPNTNDSAFTSGAFTFTTYNSVGGFTNVGATGAFSDGDHGCFMGVRRGDVHEVWRDGRLLATKTATVRDVDSGKAGTVGLGWNGGSSFNSTKYVYPGGYDMVGFFGRALSQAEASSFSRDPYQFLTPA